MLFQESQSSEREKEVRDYEYVPEPKRLKVQEKLQAKTNSFGEYIGKELENVESFQRHVAEKLISEVLFLARTGNLTFDTKIERPKFVLSQQPLSVDSDSHPTSVFVHSSAVPQYILPVPRIVATSSILPSDLKPPSDGKPPSVPQAAKEAVLSPSLINFEIKDELLSD